VKPRQASRNQNVKITGTQKDNSKVLESILWVKRAISIRRDKSLNDVYTTFELQTIQRWTRRFRMTIRLLFAVLDNRAFSRYHPRLCVLPKYAYLTPSFSIAFSSRSLVHSLSLTSPSFPSFTFPSLHWCSCILIHEPFLAKSSP